MQRKSANDQGSSEPRQEAPGSTQERQQRVEQSLNLVEEEKVDTSTIATDEIAYLIKHLTDENVIKTIQKSCKSPQAGLPLNEILDALGDIAGARTHLGRLMVEELHRKVADDHSDSSEDSVIRRSDKRVQTSEIDVEDLLNSVSSDQFERVAVAVRSDLDRVCVLLFKQEAELIEKQKIREAKEFLSQHGIAMPEAVRDQNPSRPIDKMDITKMSVKKIQHTNRRDIEARTVYRLFEPKNDPGKFKRN